MPSQHKNPLLGWRPPAELSAWARAEAERRGVKIGAFLTGMLSEKRARTNCPASPAAPSTASPRRTSP